MDGRYDLDDLFDECVELAPGERELRLKSVEAADAELGRELRSLLLAHAEAPSFLEKFPAAEGAAGPGEGDEIAGYRLLAQLGEGGMGTVFLAEKADLSFEHRVAIKFVRGGLITPALVARFSEEQRILAMLNHQNIARLYDAGVTDAGCPFLVMEYVEGVPLIEYCDERRLTIDERLELFRTLCDAIQYAHQRLVVHRDLKPSNILVTAGGKPKLLDFGIAKLVAATGEENDATRTALRAMTPTYAAPEQILGGEITTATDVYGLGIILYELMTGERPHAIPGRPRHEIERRVCDEDADPPSRRVASGIADSAAGSRSSAEIAEDRGVTPDRLRRQLRGELDNIALMALRRQPAERYRSALLLAEDLGRYSKHLPVLAQRQTLSYRLSRFVRRNRVSVAAAGLVLCVLIAAVASVAVGRQRAELEAHKASQIAGFLSEMFEYANPDRAGGSAPTVQQMLDEGARRIEEELNDQPRTRAELQRVMARAYHASGNYDAAEGLLTQSVETLRRLPDAEVPLASSLHTAALVYRSKAEFERGVAAANESLQIRRRVIGGSGVQVAQSLGLVANLAADQGDGENSVILLREALEIYGRTTSKVDQDGARLMNDLGMYLSRAGELVEAENWLRSALEIQLEALSAAHPDTATTMNNLAVLLRRAGKPVEAKVFYEKALEMRRVVHPGGHPDVAQSLNNLGAFHYSVGEYEEAERLFSEALDAWRLTLPEDHPQIATVQTNLSALARKRGDSERAFELLLEVLAKQHSRFGELHPRTLDVVYRLGVVDNDRGRYRAALTRLEEVYRKQREEFGVDRATAKTILAIGTSELGLRRLASAETHLEEALSFFVSTEDSLAEECRELLREIAELRGDTPDALDSPDVVAQTG